jgi:hypothetical protein
VTTETSEGTPATLEVVLEDCNETELLALAKRQGLGQLRIGLPKEELLAIVSGDINPEPQHYPDSVRTRLKLQTFIQDRISVVRSQLPGCDGLCTTYPCSEVRHAACLAPNRKALGEEP